MSWFYVVLAAFVEVFWVVGLKYANTPLEWAGSIVAIIFSFYFSSKSCHKLPAGTVYSVFRGSGAAAIGMVDYFIFNANFTATQFAFIALIIFGVVGIKVTTEQTESRGQEGM